MKVYIPILSLMSLILIPSIGHSFANSKPCESVVPIISDLIVNDNRAKIEALKAALERYSEHLRSASTGAYEICGARLDDIMKGKIPKISLNEKDLQALFGDGDFQGFKLNKKEDGMDVYVVGFEIDVADDVELGGPVFRIVNSGSSAAVFLRAIKIKGVKGGGGIATAGAGLAQVDDVVVEGDSKRGVCISVGSKGALLNNVKASGCSDGFKVTASGVRLTDCVATDNKIGIHSMERGTVIERPRLYNNIGAGDGIPSRFNDFLIGVDSMASRDLRFMSVIEGEVVDMSVADGVVVFEDSPAYIVLPELPEQDATIEFQPAGDGDCGGEAAGGQVCGQVGTTITINADALREVGVFQVKLDDVLIDKPLVAIYSVPGLGSSPISGEFEFIGIPRPEINFVVNPDDISAEALGGSVDLENLKSLFAP